MSFAEEFTKVTRDKVAMPTNDTSPATTQEVSHSGTEMFNNVVEAASTETTPETTLKDIAPDGKVPEPQAEKTPAKIRIGTQEFNSLEDATRYANELELALVAQESFNKGKESAQPKTPAEPVKTIEDEIEEELFVDPKKALAKYKQSIMDELKKTIKDEKTAEQKAHQAAETTRQTWEDFYSKNNDLSKHRELVEFVLNKNPELLDMEGSKALAELASKTRSYINSARETQLPTQELQSKVVLAPQGGTPTTTTKQPTVETAIDFISQVRKLNKNKAVQAEG
jgi:hypothetical protein